MSLDALVSEAQSAIALALEGAENPCVTSSFQHDCVALLHLVTAARPGILVLFLETGYHFPETIEYRDRITREWNLNLRNLEAKQSVADQESQFGILNQTAPDRCCALRKVEPLFAGLEPFDTWFTALRREQSPTRANLKIADDFRTASGHDLRKISPLASWTNRDVWQYLEHHSIPALPLYDQGYTSIGCQPCTSLPLSADDLRSGRWQGKKLECGIHIQAQ
jgi:phosphoadenosine phosphosulfate reductase